MRASAATGSTCSPVTASAFASVAGRLPVVFPAAAVAGRVGVVRILDSRLGVASAAAAVAVAGRTPADDGRRGAE